MLPCRATRRGTDLPTQHSEACWTVCSPEWSDNEHTLSESTVLAETCYYHSRTLTGRPAKVLTLSALSLPQWCVCVCMLGSCYVAQAILELLTLLSRRSQCSTSACSSELSLPHMEYRCVELQAGFLDGHRYLN